MMDFPPDSWDFFPLDAFDTASARDPGYLGMEALMQVRSNGRMLDHFKIVLGGSRNIEVKKEISSVLNLAEDPGYTFTYQVWARDILIRRNMTTTEWMDFKELVASNTMLVKDGAGATQNEQVVAIMEADPSVGGALRWAVCIGIDKKMELVLQAMPAAAPIISSKPSLNG